MHRSIWATLVVGVSAVAWGTVVACGSEVSTAVPIDDDAEAPSLDGAPSRLDAGVEASDEEDVCGLTPELHPSKGLRCPNVTDAGLSSTCSTGDVCCQAPVDASARSTCETACPQEDGGPWPGVIWECQDPVHCAGKAGAAACCGIGVIVEDTDCGYTRARPFRGTSCKPACAANEFVVCETSDQCPAGTTCRAIKARGAQFGACLP
jgi:hypothetical protein